MSDVACGVCGQAGGLSCHRRSDEPLCWSCAESVAGHPPGTWGGATVAALYVERGGSYWGRGDVDAWDADRDARLYNGSLPVVAHPPCHLWVNLSGVNYVRHGGPHNRPGNDGGCFAMALEAVRRCGGVLEHPAGSHAWSTFYIDRPERGRWSRARGRGEWVCEVWQSAYGHRARKRTWLLFAGREQPPPMRWGRPAGTHQVGWFDRKKPSLSKREASATPAEFLEALTSLARIGSRR